MRNSVTPRTLAELALGRIFLLGSRPFQPGDTEEYERCRAIILDGVGQDMPADYKPNYVRDRLRGAQEPNCGHKSYKNR